MYASADTGKGFGSACPAGMVGVSGGGDGGKALKNLVQGWATGAIANNGIDRLCLRDHVEWVCVARAVGAPGAPNVAGVSVLLEQTSWMSRFECLVSP